MYKMNDVGFSEINSKLVLMFLEKLNLKNLIQFYL